jgi:D-glycero-alpha-D-manno-heptose-7-phosphate kinase
LASSSSYTLALVKAVSKFKKIPLSDAEVCKISLEIEKKFNKHTGYQDIYGCGIGSLKRIDFKKSKDPKFTYLSQKIFNDINMYLIFTNTTRSSTGLLSNLDLQKRKKLLPLVDQLEKSIKENNKSDFFDIINEGWKKKKETSPLIMDNSRVIEIDDHLSENKNILSHKLCGAGAGGFFLAFTKDKATSDKFIPISISEDGIRSLSI